MDGNASRHRGPRSGGTIDSQHCQNRLKLLHYLSQLHAPSHPAHLFKTLWLPLASGVPPNGSHTTPSLYLRAFPYYFADRTLPCPSHGPPPICHTSGRHQHRSQRRLHRHNILVTTTPFHRPSFTHGGDVAREGVRGTVETSTINNWTRTTHMTLGIPTSRSKHELNKKKCSPVLVADGNGCF